ncbi:MAG: hypothetical protein GY795_51185, partial [Desulfobacterales bacterium]|nr:hypothetical protein [Desulfobacterales bacterium]
MLKNSSDRYTNTKLRYYAGRFAVISAMCFVICLIIIPSVAQEITTTPYEDNDILEKANEIVPDTELQEHTFHDIEDEDWIKFKAVQGKTYIIEAKYDGSFGSFVWLELYDAGNNIIEENNNPLFTDWSLEDPMGVSRLTRYFKTGGDYYVRAFPMPYINNMRYTLEVKTVEYISVSANEAEAVEFNPGDMRWFVIDGVQGERYSVEITTSGIFDIRVFSDNERDYEYIGDISTDGLTASTGTYQICWTSASDQEYYVEISDLYSFDGTFDGNITYDIKVSDNALCSDPHETANKTGDDLYIFATELTLFEPSRGHNLHNSEDADWFRFQGIGNTTYRIEIDEEYSMTENCSFDIGFYKIDVSGELNSLEYGENPETNFFDLYASESNDYYIEVSQSGTIAHLCEIFAYNITLHVNRPIDAPTDDLGDPDEENNSRENATFISVCENTFQRLNFHNPEDVDWFKFEATLGVTYSFQADNLGSNCNIALELYDASNLLQPKETDTPDEGSKYLEWTLTDDNASDENTRYIKIYPADSQNTCAGTEYDFYMYAYPDGCYAEDFITMEGWLLEGYTNFDQDGDEDWIRIDGTSDDVFIIDTTDLGNNSNVKFEVYEDFNASGRPLAFTGIENESSNTLVFVPPEEGDYYLRLTNSTASPSYSETEYKYQIKKTSRSSLPSGYIKGNVTDTITGNGIGGVLVKTSGGIETITNTPTGYYLMEHPSGGFYSITAEAECYEKYEDKVEVNGNLEDNIKNIALNRTCLENPILFPPAGTYFEAKNVEIKYDKSLTARYTTGDSKPDVNSTPYTDNPFYLPSETVPTETTLNVKAFNSKGEVASETVSGIYYFIVSAPAFNESSEPGADNKYNNEISVKLSCYTRDAVIYYITDREPAPTWQIYNDDTPISVSSDTKIRAKASKTYWSGSRISEKKYNFKVANPSFNPESRTYDEPLYVSIECSTKDADVYYSINNEPTVLYSDPIWVTENMAITAEGYKQNWENSDITVGEYKVTGKVATPDFSLDSGTYPGAKIVILSCSKPSDATIHYTTNGAEPTELSTRYVSPISVSSSVIIMAKAFKAGWTESDRAVRAYTITGTVATPVFSPGPDAYPTAQSIELSCITPDAAIHYITDSSEPVTEESPVYDGPITVSSSTTIRAKAFKTDWLASETATGAYTITGTVAKPVFFPDSGSYPTAQSIELSCATSGAVIRYTEDGSEPTENSKLYSETIQVSSSTTIRAKAFKTDWLASDTATGAYTITGTVASPVFFPDSGTYSTAQNIELSCATFGAVIRYTEDGSEPTESSTLYSETIQVSSSTTIRAKAFKTDWLASDTATGA